MNNVDPACFNIISLCTGAAQLDRGAEAALAWHGIRTRVVAYCERDAPPCAAILARMEEESLEPAPIWAGNLESFPAREFHGKVDGITAGFPCQPHSVAGGRKGREDQRNLLPEILKIAESSGAWFCLLENVAGLKKEFDYITGLLLQRGWNCEWGTLAAADVGASHKRERWFGVAYRQHLPTGTKRWLESWQWANPATLHGSVPGQQGSELLAHGDHPNGGQPIAGRGSESGTAAAGDGTELGNAHKPGSQRRHQHAGKHPGELSAGQAGADMGGDVGNTAGDHERGDSFRKDGKGQQAGRSGGDLENPGCTQHGGSAHPQGIAGERASGGAGRTGSALGHCDCAGCAEGTGNDGSEEGPQPGCRAVPGGHGAQFHILPAFAPGPESPDWGRILSIAPWLAPALPVSPMAMREAWCAILGGAEVEAESSLCRLADGLGSTVDRALCYEGARTDLLRIAGNGVVPQQAAWAYFQLLPRAFAKPTKNE